jgi:hypothetical protein
MYNARYKEPPYGLIFYLPLSLSTIFIIRIVPTVRYYLFSILFPLMEIWKTFIAPSSNYRSSPFCVYVVHQLNVL